MGNRIFGCDDCQLVCPWNKFADYTLEADFKPRHGLENADLVSEIVSALQCRLSFPSALVREHVLWALDRHGACPATVQTENSVKSE